jgi:hypothetical protein
MARTGWKTDRLIGGIWRGLFLGPSDRAQSVLKPCKVYGLASVKAEEMVVIWEGGKAPHTGVRPGYRQLRSQLFRRSDCTEQRQAFADQGIDGREPAGNKRSSVGIGIAHGGESGLPFPWDRKQAALKRRE